jgi:phosphatidylethanolamine-binding protein (PEBP) family uncharacterized protein
MIGRYQGHTVSACIVGPTPTFLEMRKCPVQWGKDITRRGKAKVTYGLHRYFFRLYSFDEVLEPRDGLDKPGSLNAIVGHIVAQGEFMRTYQR